MNHQHFFWPTSGVLLFCCEFHYLKLDLLVAHKLIIANTNLARKAKKNKKCETRRDVVIPFVSSYIRDTLQLLVAFNPPRQ